MGKLRSVSRRRVLGLGATAAIGTVLAACGQSAPSAPTQAPSTTGSTSASAPTAAPAATSAPAANQAADTLIVWDYNEVPLDLYNKELPSRLDAFKKTYPNDTIKYEILNWDDGPNKLEVALKSGNPPDVYHNGFSPGHVGTGLMIDLTPYLPSSDKEDYYPFTLDNLSYKGKLYAFPDWVTMWCMAGNQTMLEKAGVDWRKIQKEGWTRDELVEAAVKMTDPSKNVFGLMWNAIYGNGEELLWAGRNNGIPYPGVLTPDGKFTLTGPKAVEAMQWLLDTFKKYKISPPEQPAIDNHKVSAAFDAEQAAIITRSGEWAVPNANRRNAQIDTGKAKGNKFNAILLPWPHATNEKEMGFTGVGGDNVFRQKQAKSDDHITAAAAYALIAAKGEDWQTAIYTGTLPARQSTAKQLQDSKQHPLLTPTPENYDFSLRYVQTAPAPVILPADLDVKATRISKEAVYPNFQAALAGTLTAEQAIQKMTDAANTILTSSM